MHRFAIYARKSSEDKRETAKSIKEQLESAHDVARQQGLLVYKEYQESKSAMKPGLRPLYAEMISLVERGEIDGIICWQVNRLVRNMEEGGKLAQLLIDGKLRQICTHTAIHRSGDNIYPLVLEAAQSTQYSLDLRDNVIRGLTGHLENGGWNSKAYTGYRNERDPVNGKRGIVVPDGDRFTLLRKAWDMMLSGAYTPAQVIHHLNTTWGYRTRKTERSGGQPITRSHAYNIFRNPFYAGYTLCKGQLRKGNHPPMVTEEEFSRVQEYLDRNLTQRTVPRILTYTGLIRCGYCGLQVTGEYKVLKNGKPWVNYRCSNSRGCCTNRGLSEEKIESIMRERLDEITIDPELCDVAVENIIQSLDGECVPIETIHQQQNEALADIQRQKRNLKMMWLRELITDEDEYKQTEKELNDQEAQLTWKMERSRQELEHMRANAFNATTYTKIARDRFMISSPTKKREIVNALGIEYQLFGAEKKLIMQTHPLLVEVTEYVRGLSGAFEPHVCSSESLQTNDSMNTVLFGRTEQTLLELNDRLKMFLRESNFPDLFTTESLG
jgi:DNA invertase Pin-like site-specific DNA recombinase